MVDNRTSGHFGIGGAFNFKSGDISGTAAKSSDDRQSPGMEYFQQQQEEEQKQKNPHVDRSAQLNATLNSLAMTNIASILHKQKRKKDFNDSIQNLSNIDNELINKIESNNEESEGKDNKEDN